MSTIPFIWSNDDITVGQTDKLRRQLELLDRHGIPGVFFVIPRLRERNIDQDADLLRAIDKARSKGHEFYQHGYIHTAFECGVPETWMLQFDPPTMREFDARRMEIEAQHTLAALVRMLESGQTIWRRAMHEDSAGFRPGWGAFCTNLYIALEALGFSWVSSRIPSPTSWLWNQNHWGQPMNFREHIPLKPHRINGMTEYPITGGDYAFNVPNETDRIDAMVNLGMQEFDYLHQRGCPMLMISHWHGLERNNGTGYAVHEKLIPALLATGRAEPMGMTKLRQISQA